MKTIVSLALVLALIGVAAVGVVDAKSDNANENAPGQDNIPDVPGQNGQNPGQSDGEYGPPGNPDQPTGHDKE